MAESCPSCGSADVTPFPDGSGVCKNCGRAIRGATPPGALLKGEQVARKTAVVREKSRLGALGIVGGLLGFLAIPGLFVIGAALRGRSLGDYVSGVFNEPTGALTCGGIVLLAVGGWYALWAGYFLWRGFGERAIHGIVSGIVLIAAGGIAGQGLPGILAIAGGGLAVVAGVLIFLRTRAKEEETPPPSAESS